MLQTLPVSQWQHSNGLRQPLLEFLFHFSQIRVTYLVVDFRVFLIVFHKFENLVMVHIPNLRRARYEHHLQLWQYRFPFDISFSRDLEILLHLYFLGYGIATYLGGPCAEKSHLRPDDFILSEVIQRRPMNRQMIVRHAALFTQMLFHPHTRFLRRLRLPKRRLLP